MMQCCEDTTALLFAQLCLINRLALHRHRSGQFGRSRPSLCQRGPVAPRQRAPLPLPSGHHRPPPRSKRDLEQYLVIWLANDQAAHIAYLLFHYGLLGLIGIERKKVA